MPWNKFTGWVFVVLKSDYTNHTEKIRAAQDIYDLTQPPNDDGFVVRADVVSTDHDFHIVAPVAARSQRRFDTIVETIKRHSKVEYDYTTQATVGQNDHIPDPPPNSPGYHEEDEPGRPDNPWG